jgi:hypothetical protein
MDYVSWIVLILIILYFYFTYKMFDHIALNRPEQRGKWILFWLFTHALAVFYYYFVHLIPENKEKKIVGSKTKSIDPEINKEIKSETKVIKSKNKQREKLFELILFVGGSFVFIISLTGGFYSYGGGDPLGIGFSSGGRSGFRTWSIFGMAIGISMLVYGFLRRSWKK